MDKPCDDCPGIGTDGCCREEFEVESHDLQPEQNFIAESYVFPSVTLETIINDIVEDLETLTDAYNELREEFDSFRSKHAS